MYAVEVAAVNQAGTGPQSTAINRMTPEGRK